MQIERFNNNHKAILLKIFLPKILLEQAAGTEVVRSRAPKVVKQR